MKILKVVVDELPKSCLQCPFYEEVDNDYYVDGERMADDFYWCDALFRRIYDNIYRSPMCPLVEMPKDGEALLITGPDGGSNLIQFDIEDE